MLRARVPEFQNLASFLSGEKVTTISDKKAEKCLNDWLQYMFEINSPLLVKVVKLRGSGKTYKITIKEEDSKF
jgi:hypothetical protein